MTTWTAATLTTATALATDTPATPAPGSPTNPRAPLSARVALVDYWDGRGSGGITQIQKLAPGATSTPRVPPHGGGWAARALPRLRQRSVNFNIDVADVGQLVASRLASFRATHAYLTVYAGIVTLPPGPPVVAEREFIFHGGSQGLAMSTTVTQALGPLGAGAANTWTVWLQVNGLYQALPYQGSPERKTLLVRCTLPITVG